MQTEKETQVCTEFEPLSPGCQLRWMVTGYISHKHDTAKKRLDEETRI